MSGLETASLVSLKQLAILQERGVPFLPVDGMTDCKDFYSLSTRSTSLSQDKSQCIYTLAHRKIDFADDFVGSFWFLLSQWWLTP